MNIHSFVDGRATKSVRGTWYVTGVGGVCNCGMAPDAVQHWHTPPFRVPLTCPMSKQHGHLK